MDVVGSGNTLTSEAYLPASLRQINWGLFLLRKKAWIITRQGEVMQMIYRLKKNQPKFFFHLLDWIPVSKSKTKIWVQMHWDGNFNSFVGVRKIADYFKRGMSDSSVISFKLTSNHTA